MFLITPILLLFAVFVMWAFFKSITRFKRHYLWYQHSRRPTNRVCRTIVGQQTQRQGSAAVAQQTICTHQCNQHHQTPICATTQDQQLYYARAQSSATSAYPQQTSVMEMRIPYNYVPPYYYNPPLNPYQYYDPPPTYPGLIPATQSDPTVNQTISSYPSAPTLADETKE